MFYFLRRFKKLIIRKHPTLFILFLSTFFVMLYGTTGFHYIEGYEWLESFYWTVTTMSTVGYGDYSPKTPLGRAHAMTIMVLGIGIFGLVIESFVSFLLNFSEKRKRGLIQITTKQHILICGWSESIREAILELQHHHNEIFLLNEDLDLKDIIDQMEAEVTFIKGDPTRSEDLRRARVEEASMIIIDLPTDSESLDALISIRNLTDTKIVVEVERAENREKFIKAGADEITIPFVLSGRLIAQSHSKKFLARFVTEVLSTSSGLNLEEIEVTKNEDYAGKKLSELAGGDILPDIYIIAVGRDKELFLDTRGEITIEPGDRLICLKNSNE